MKLILKGKYTMSVSSIIREFDEVPEISPAQRRIYLAGIIKEMALSGIRNARTFCIAMQMLAENDAFPNLTIKVGQSVAGFNTVGDDTILLEGNFGQPTLSTVISLLKALGNLKNSQDQLAAGGAALTQYFSELNKRFIEMNTESRADIMLMLAKPAYNYLQTNHPKFIDHLPDIDTFLVAWTNGLGDDKVNLDSVMNAAFINVLFGTQIAHDIFKIYLAVSNTPIDGEIMSPSTADFMGSYLMAACAGI